MTDGEIKLGWILVGVNTALAIIMALESNPGLCLLHTVVVILLVGVLIIGGRREK